MQSVSLFELASRQAEWISVKQKAVASNIANVNTPNYTPLEVTPFKEVLGQSAGALTRTNEFHLASDGGNGQFAATERTRDPMNPDGQKVSLEQELIDGSSTRRSYELNTAIVKSFHRMMLMTARAS